MLSWHQMTFLLWWQRDLSPLDHPWFLWCKQCSYLRSFNYVLHQGTCIWGIGSSASCSHWRDVLEIDIVMSSSLFMLITYYSVMTDTSITLLLFILQQHLLLLMSIPIASPCLVRQGSLLKNLQMESSSPTLCYPLSMSPSPSIGENSVDKNLPEHV